MAGSQEPPGGWAPGFDIPLEETGEHKQVHPRDSLRGTPTIELPGANLAERSVKEQTDELYAEIKRLEAERRNTRYPGDVTERVGSEIQTSLSSYPAEAIPGSIAGSEVESLTGEQIRAMSEAELREKLSQLEELKKNNDSMTARVLLYQDRINEIEKKKEEAEELARLKDEEIAATMRQVARAQATARDQVADRDRRIEELTKTQAATADQKNLEDELKRCRAESAAERTRHDNEIADNIRRIDDLEAQLKRCHAENASNLKRYDLESADANRRINELRNRISGVTRQESQASLRAKELETQVNDLQTQVKILEEALARQRSLGPPGSNRDKRRVAELESKLSEVERDHLEALKQAMDLVDEVTIQRQEEVERTRMAQDQADDLAAEIQRLEEDKKKLKRDKKKADDELKTAEEKVKQWVIDERKEAERTADLDDQINVLAGQIVTLEDRNNRLRITNTSLRQQQAAKPQGEGEGGVGRLASDLQKLQGDMANLEKENRSLREELEGLRRQAKEKRTGTDECEKEVTRLEEENEKLRAELESLQREYDHLRKWVDTKAIEANELLDKADKKMKDLEQQLEDCRKGQGQTQDPGKGKDPAQPFDEDLVKDLEGQVGDLKYQLDDANQLIDEAHKRIKNLQRALEDCRKGQGQGPGKGQDPAQPSDTNRIKDLERQIRDLNHQIDDSNQVMGDSAKMIDVLQQQLEDCQKSQGREKGSAERIKKLEKQIRDLQHEVDDSNQLTSDAFKRIKDLEQKLEDCHKAQAQAQAQAQGQGQGQGQGPVDPSAAERVRELEAQIRDLREDLVETQTEFDTLKDQRDQDENNLDSALDQLKRLEREEQQCQREKRQQAGVIKRLQTQLADIQKELVEAQEQVAAGLNTAGGVPLNPEQTAHIQSLQSELAEVKAQLAVEEASHLRQDAQDRDWAAERARLAIVGVEVHLNVVVLQRAIHGFQNTDTDRALAVALGAVQAAEEQNVPKELLAQAKFWYAIVLYYSGNRREARTQFLAVRKIEEWQEERDNLAAWIKETHHRSGTEVPRSRNGYRLQLGLEVPLTKPPGDDKKKRKSRRPKAPRRHRRRRNLYVGILTPEQEAIWDTIDFEQFDYDQLSPEQQALFSFDAPPPQSPVRSQRSSGSSRHSPRLPPPPPSSNPSDDSDDSDNGGGGGNGGAGRRGGRSRSVSSDESARSDDPDINPVRLFPIVTDQALHIQQLSSLLSRSTLYAHGLEMTAGNLGTERNARNRREGQIVELRRVIRRLQEDLDRFRANDWWRFPI